MTRLNNSIRDSIINAAVFDAFDEKIKKHKAKETPLADKLYEMTYGEISEKVRKAKLPEGWTRSSTRLRIICDGFQYYRTDKNLSDQLEMSESNYVPLSGYDNHLTIGPEHPMFQEFQDWLNEHIDIQAEKAKLLADVKANVYSCNTVKQLLDKWPESEVYLKAIPTRGTAIVPLMLVKDVNKRIGLPKSEDKK